MTSVGPPPIKPKKQIKALRAHREQLVAQIRTCRQAVADFKAAKNYRMHRQATRSLTHLEAQVRDIDVTLRRLGG